MQYQAAPAMLKELNQKLMELGFSYTQALMENFPICPALNHKRILMVDDDRRNIGALFPYFFLASQGSADFIYHDGESMTELVGQIVSKSPEIILMDYYLSRRITGVEVMKEVLAASKSDIKFIGFSSAKSKGDVFVANGAIGAVQKNAQEPLAVLNGVAEILS